MTEQLSLSLSVLGVEKDLTNKTEMQKEIRCVEKD